MGIQVIQFEAGEQIKGQSAHPNTLTTQMRVGESHLTVTVPSTSLSQ